MILHQPIWLLVYLFLSGYWEGLAEAPAERQEAAAILVFYKTAEFYHESIPAGVAAMQQLGRENGVAVDTTRDAGVFTQERLRKYRAVVFLNTTGDVLDAEQQAAFEQYIRGGRGFVGVHSATDTEYDWAWYQQLVGATFNGHPRVQKAHIHVTDKTHTATSFLPDRWVRRDEWYNFKNIQPTIRVLATLDESSYKGGTNGQHHPIAWFHEFDGGRAFYTAGGHTPESFREPLFLQHLWGGVCYAMGH